MNKKARTNDIKVLHAIKLIINNKMTVSKIIMQKKC